MASYLARVMFTTSGAPGAGAFTCGAAVSSFRTPVVAAIPDGTSVPYTAWSADFTQVEFGNGTYHAATNAITRDEIDGGTGSGAAINFTSAPTVWLGGTGGLRSDAWLDFVAPPPVTAPTVVNGSTTNDVNLPNATLATSSSLSVSLVSNTNYIISGVLCWTNSAQVAGFQFSLQVSDGLSSVTWTIGDSIAKASGDIVQRTGTSSDMVTVSGFASAGVNGTTLSIQLAQAVLDNTHATILKSGSYISARGAS